MEYTNNKQALHIMATGEIDAHLPQKDFLHSLTVKRYKRD